MDLKRVLGNQAGSPSGGEGSKLVINDDTKVLINKWEQQVASGDEIERKRALEWLGQASKQAALASVKSYAAEALQRIATPSGSSSGLDEIQPQTSTAHETALDEYGLPVEK